MSGVWPSSNSLFIHPGEKSLKQSCINAITMSFMIVLKGACLRKEGRRVLSGGIGGGVLNRRRHGSAKGRENRENGTRLIKID